MAIEERERRKFTASEYDMMIEYHIIDSSEKVELLEGDIYLMTPHGPPHVATVHLGLKMLESLFGPGHIVISQSSLPAGMMSKAEPDLLVVEGTWERYLASGPARAVLVVEVADSTLDTDRVTKSRIYAGAGIPEYWVINLVHRQLEVFRSPRLSDDNWNYADCEILHPGDTVSPRCLPDRKVPVSDFFPATWHRKEGKTDA